MRKQNLDRRTVAGFGHEWSRFDQLSLPGDEFKAIFHQYFAIFDFHALPSNAVGFDAGCGSGRWAKGVAPRVGTLHCVDVSPDALRIAQVALRDQSNCRFHLSSIDHMPFPDGSMDFGYSLGVLHHVPDTAAGLKSCVQKLKPGAPFLLYLYYALENKPGWYRNLWRLSNGARMIISRLPATARQLVAETVAALVYLPLARSAAALEWLGMDVSSFPLSFYRRRTFYTMRTDALDRFGTPLEHRFRREEIEHMMRVAGLDDVRFSERPPYWCAVGRRRQEVA